MARHAETHSEHSGPKWSDVTPDDLEDALHSALGGDEYAERCLVEYFHERITAQQPYDLRILESYLVQVFGQTLNRIADKDDASVLLRRKRGRPEVASKEERDLCLAAAVVLRMRYGGRWEQAVHDVAEGHCVSDRVVQRALEDNRFDIEKLTDAELEGLLEES
jgi:hypothetical protein